MNHKLNDQDHDLLIRLDTKMDTVMQAFKDFHSSIMPRLIKLETRMDADDLYHAKIPLADYDNAYRWVSKVRDNMAALIIVGGGILAGIGGAIGHLIFKLFGL